MRVSDIAEHLFNRTDTSSVLITTLIGVELVIHFFRILLRRAFCFSEKERNLPYWRALRVTQTVLSRAIGHASIVQNLIGVQWASALRRQYCGTVAPLNASTGSFFRRSTLRMA
jgi:hypothetical protein